MVNSQGSLKSTPGLKEKRECDPGDSLKVLKFRFAAIVDVETQDRYAVILERFPDLFFYRRTRLSAQASVVTQIIEHEDAAAVICGCVGLAIQPRKRK